MAAKTAKKLENKLDRPPMTAKEKKIHDQGVKRLKDIIEYDSTNRAKAVEDLEFLNGEQWDAKVLKNRRDTGRPALTHNRLPQFVKHVASEFMQSRPSIKVHPAGEGASKEMSEVLGGLIRNIEYVSNGNDAYDEGFVSAVRCGYGAWRIVAEYVGDDTFNQDLRIRRIVNPFSVYADIMNATEADKSDMNFCFIREWYGRDDFKEKFGMEPPTGANLATAAGDAQWHTSKEVAVVEYYWREKSTKIIVELSEPVGMVMEKEFITPEMMALFKQQGVKILRERESESYSVFHCIMDGAGFIEKPVKIKGQYIPVVLLFGDEIWINGKMHWNGMIRDAKDSQRQYNFWMTALTELFALQPKSPFIGTTKMFQGVEHLWAAANNSNTPYLAYNPDEQVPGGRPERQEPPQIPNSALAMVNLSSQQMKEATGIFDTTMGNQSNETSGRAINARVKQGQGATYGFVDRTMRAIRLTGKILVDLIPYYYDNERIINITKDDNRTEAVKINTAQFDYEKFEWALINDVNRGKYDVMIDTGPAFLTRRMEAVNSIMQFIDIYPQAAPILADVIARNSDWPGAEQIAERLMFLLPPQIQVAEAQRTGRPLPPPPPPDPNIEIKKTRASVEAENAKTKRMLAVSNVRKNEEDAVREHVASGHEILKTLHGQTMDKMNMGHELLKTHHEMGQALTGGGNTGEEG